MRDGLGNKIDKGHLLFWPRVGVAAKVVLVNEGGLSVVGRNGNEVTQPSLVVEIVVGVNTQGLPPGVEPQVPEFIRVVDPRQETLLDSLLEGKRQ